MSTGWLILQNAHHLFRTQTLARANYWAELDEILHGTLLGDSTWDSRGFFWISIWGLRNWVPLRVPLGVRYFEKKILYFLNFFDENRSVDVKIARKKENQPLIRDLRASLRFSKISRNPFLMKSTVLKIEKSLETTEWRTSFHFYERFTRPQTHFRRKNKKNLKKILKIFWPPGGPLGVPHNSAPRSKFKKPLDYPT